MQTPAIAIVEMLQCISQAVLSCALVPHTLLHIHTHSHTHTHADPCHCNRGDAAVHQPGRVSEHTQAQGQGCRLLYDVPAAAPL
jgi:hypothetical protein